MESKLNLIAIQEYSDELAEIFLKESGSKKDYFNGKDILNLNEVKQVNLFILRQIFFDWLEQNQKMRSPYFDFEDQKVSKTLEDLMNLLSHNIKVPAILMKDLYSQAIRDTILFYLVPDYFLIHFINELEDSLKNIDTLKRLKTYIDLNKDMFADVLKKIDSQKIDLSNAASVQGLISSISFEAEEKEIFDYFSSKKELDVEAFLNIDEDKPQTSKKSDEDFEEGRHFKFDNEKIINEKFKSEEPTLNDKLKGGKSPSLVDNMQKQKINDISKSISLNQRFIFVKDLFEGNLDNYQNALNELDALNSWEEANQFIEDSIANKYNWDISKDSVAEFTEIVKRRFQ